MENKKPIWKAERVIHKGRNRIVVYFERSPELVNRIKKLPNARWSSTLKAWHLPDNHEMRIRFKIETDKIANKNEDINAFIRWLRSKRDSESTIKTYVNAIRWFLLSKCKGNFMLN